MKLKYSFLILALTLLPFTKIEAKNSTNDGNVSLHPESFVIRGDSVFVNIFIDFQDARVLSGKSIEVIPIITDGSNLLVLEKVVLKGKRNFKQYEREQNLSQTQGGKQLFDYYAVRDAQHGLGGSIYYKQVLKLEPWMLNSRLEARTAICGFRNITHVDEPQLLVDKLVVDENYVDIEAINSDPVNFDPSLSYITPESDSLVVRHFREDFYLNFVNECHDIRKYFGNNREELSLIDSLMTNLQGNPSFSIDSLRIVGYSSPEGANSNNLKLASKRANEVKAFFVRKYSVPESSFSTSFAGEDWDGLKLMIQNYELEDSTKVIDIINDTTVNRQWKINTLDEGKISNFMMSEYYPSLRRASIDVFYAKSVPFNAEASRHQIGVDPLQMSISEFKTLANTYDVGSDDYVYVYTIASRCFPSDAETMINLAMFALSKRNLSSAKSILSNVKTRSRIPEYDNAMGILSVFLSEPAAAEMYFKAASEAGLTAATENLDRFSKLKFKK